MGKEKEIKFNPINIEMSGGLSALDRDHCDPCCPQFESLMHCKAFKTYLVVMSVEGGHGMMNRCQQCKDFEDEFKKRMP